jgi:cbb3-type cytochrome oxidase subunit 1
MSSKTSLNYCKVAVIYLLLYGMFGAFLARGPVPEFLSNTLGPFYSMFQSTVPIYVNTMGWLSMLGMGAVYYLVPHILEKKASSERLGKISLALLNIGIIGYVVSMFVASYLGGRLFFDAYNAGTDYDLAVADALQAVDPLLVSSTVFLYATAASFFVFAYDIYKITLGK